MRAPGRCPPRTRAGARKAVEVDSTRIADISRFLVRVDEDVFAGGCFFISAMSELDAHPGPLRDEAMAFSGRWLGLLAEEVAAGQAAGEIDPAAEPAQIAFEPTRSWSWATCSASRAAGPSPVDAVRRAVDTRLAALSPRRS